ncbi:Subtilase family protein [Rhodospirillales bacterium URHD0017]|nr:Subtilase family protein [Rhodospirillales bacterium URHD0017]
MPIENMEFSADPWIFWFTYRDAAQGTARTEKIHVLVEAGSNWPAEIEFQPIYDTVYPERRVRTGRMAPDLAALEAVRGQVKRLKIARAVLPQLGDALPALGAGAATGSRPGDWNGGGVVIGFVDNGCAFAHRNFTIPDPSRGIRRSRVTRLWDQSMQEPKKWPAPTGFDYGGELPLDQYDMLTGQRLDKLDPKKPEPELSMEETYGRFDYVIKENVDGQLIETEFAHGTHVMDIAAGSGDTPGMAPGAELIFVQMPPYAIKESTELASANHLLDGIAYIFERAGNRPAVVNISYNSYIGPHDGTGLIEVGLDEFLQRPNRAIVISAGNGGDQRCHAARTIAAGGSATLRWEIKPGDNTANFVEIWYRGDADLSVDLVRDGAPAPNEPVPKGKKRLVLANGRPVGAIIHRADDQGSNHQNQVLIGVDPRFASSTEPVDVSGTWTIVIKNDGGEPVRCHAWIERDNRGAAPAIEQSRFVGEPDEGDEASSFTLGGFSTGVRTIVVGATNTALRRLEKYSGRGPTADGRPKPDFSAAGASDADGRGVLAAAARGYYPLRSNGTSMAAPFVTGLIALLMQKAMAAKPPLELDSERLRELIASTARPINKAPADGGMVEVELGAGAGQIDVAAALAALDDMLAKR